MPLAPISFAARRALATSTSTTASWNDAATSAVADVGVLADVVDHRRLEPGEREVEALVDQRPREGDGRRVALAREPVDGRAARVAEPEVAGDLVEGLAGGVVERRAEQPVAAPALHGHEHRVPARHEQHDHRQVDVGVLEEAGVQVGLEVVHRHERHVPHQGQRLGGADADEQRADQTRAVGGGDRVDVAVARTPASTSASAMTGVSSSTWARLAISGTTPP